MDSKRPHGNNRKELDCLHSDPAILLNTEQGVETSSGETRKAIRYDRCGLQDFTQKYMDQPRDFWNSMEVCQSQNRLTVSCSGKLWTPVVLPHS